MKKKANIDPLVGRHFLSSSGRIAEISKITEGAISVCWSGKETQKDREEFVEWAKTIIGPATVTEHDHGSIHSKDFKSRLLTDLRKWQSEVED